MPLLFILSLLLLLFFVCHVMIHWCPLACSRARKGGTSHRSRLMEDVSNARVTVSTPPDVELYSRELNATGGAVVSPEIYAAKVWIAAITTHLLCDLHPCPCDNVSDRTLMSYCGFLMCVNLCIWVVPFPCFLRIK